MARSLPSGRIPLPPQALVLGGVASVQFGSAFADKLFSQAGPSGVVFLRLAFGAVVLLLIARPSLRGRSRSDWRRALVFGAMLAGMNWSFYEALARLPLGPAVTIEFVGPLTVAVIGSRRWLDAVWVVLAAIGVGLLGFGRAHVAGGALSHAGIALALLAGAFWAGYIVMSKRVGSAFAGLDGLAFALVVGGAALILPGLLGGGTALARPSVLAGGFAVAMLSSVIPYSLELIALRRLSTAAFGLLMSLEPAVAALAGVLVLHQSLVLRTAVAIALVILASAGSTVAGRRPLDVGGN